MRVTLVAATQVDHLLPNSVLGTEFAEFHRTHPLTVLGSHADRLAHFSGRACYQAWDMPNEKTRTDEGYLHNIIDHTHFSVVEHSTCTFYIEDVSRSLLAELTRHRHLSFSVESQRYVDYSQSQPVIPPALRGGPGEETIRRIYAQAVIDYGVLYRQLVQGGLGKKQAREAARSVLPNCAPVRMVVSGNHRAWRDVLYRRLSPTADAEIRELAEELLRQLKNFAPGTYQDIEASHE